MIHDPQVFFWIAGGAAYIFGCLLYILRFPERFWPGKFDFVGSSHQIFHIMVFVGVALHHYASVDTYYDRLNHDCIG
jgi:adiponectin receptor